MQQLPNDYDSVNILADKLESCPTFFSCSRSRFIWICHNRGEKTPISISWHMSLFALVWFVLTPLLCSELLENNKPGTFSFQAISCCLAGPVCGYINTIQCLEMLCRFLFSWIQYMYIHFFYCFGSQLDVLTVIYLVFVCSWDAGSGCGGRVCVLYQRRAGALQGALSVWGLFSEWTPGAPPPLPGRGRPRASTMLLHSERTAGLSAESAQDCHTVRNTLSYSIQSYSSTPSERNGIHLPLYKFCCCQTPCANKNLSGLLQLMAKWLFVNVNWYFLLTH